VRVIAFISDVWRRRFGWDRSEPRGWDIPKGVEPLAHMHSCSYPLPPDVVEKMRSLATSSTEHGKTIAVTINAIDGASFYEFLKNAKKEDPK
jgi:sugar/nucleoside kinase (ribokinase family)